jgi:serine/threonine protein kinase
VRGARCHAAQAALLTLTPSCACAAHAFFLEHPTINALVGYLEGRSLARRARAFTLLGWCCASASWAASLAGHHWLRRWMLALAGLALVAWHQGWLLPKKHGQQQDSADTPLTLSFLSVTLPAAALVAFTAWPSLFFVISSLAFVFAGALPEGWLAHATGLAAGVFRDTPEFRGTTPAATRISAAWSTRSAAAQNREVARGLPEPAALPAVLTPRAPQGIAAATLGSPRIAEYEAELAGLRAGLGPEIAIEQLERGRTVGLGSYGKVMLVRHAQSGVPYALKCLNRRLVVANGQQRAVARERAVMTGVSHPFCARLVRTFKDAHAVYLLLEWCPGGELLRHLPREAGVGLPEPAVRFYVACVALALEHLHINGIIYRDIKPENCLLDGEGYLKLCDFGFAKRLGPGAEGATFTVCGTPDFMAPEVIRGVGHGRAADLWSLGVLAYELLAGRPPFCERGAAPAAIYAAVLGGVQPPPLSNASAQFSGLVDALLVTEPLARLGSRDWAEVKAHALFSDFSWDALERRQVTPPILPPLSGALDTRHFDAFPDNAVALNDTRENDDDDQGDDGSGEEHAFTPEELFGTWDRSF